MKIKYLSADSVISNRSIYYIVVMRTFIRFPIGKHKFCPFLGIFFKTQII